MNKLMFYPQTEGSVLDRTIAEFSTGNEIVDREYITKIIKIIKTPKIKKLIGRAKLSV